MTNEVTKDPDMENKIPDKHKLHIEIPENNDNNNGINIREGVLDNMAAVLDPALKSGNETEHRSIFQVRNKSL